MQKLLKTMGLPRAARGGRALTIAGMATMLSACAQPKSMYAWQAYQPSVYAYLKDDGADHAVQAELLEKNIETARSADSELPPGLRAHLGMVYLKMGDGAKAVEHFQGEKSAFPEATQFMDFLLRNAKSGSDKPVQTESAVKGF